MTIDNHTTNPVAVLRDCDGLAVIGRGRNDLMGIRNVEGEGGTGGTGTVTTTAPEAGTPAGATTATGTTTTSPPAKAEPTDDAPFGRDKDGKAYSREDTQRYIQTLRDEARASREAKEAEAAARQTAEADRAKVLAALGIGADGKEIPKDADTLSKEVDTASKALNETRQDNVVLRVAPRLEADADKLLDRRSFVDALRKLDAGDAKGIEALVIETLEKDPSLKITTAGSSSGGSSHGGTVTTTTRKSMAEAVKDGLKSRQK